MIIDDGDRKRREKSASTLRVMVASVAPCCVELHGALGSGPFKGLDQDKQSDTALWLFQIPSWGLIRPFVMDLIEVLGLAGEHVVRATNDQSALGDLFLDGLRQKWIGAESSPEKIAAAIERCYSGELPREALGEVLCALVRVGDSLEQHRLAGTRVGRAAFASARTYELLFLGLLTGFSIVPNGERRQRIALHQLCHLVKITLTSEGWTRIPEGVS